jgi:fibronectin-binding autotransporter adhesin
MKPRRIFSANPISLSFASALVAMLAVSSASASSLYWDGATPADAPGCGAGTWNTTLTNWDTSLAGGDVAWVNANLDTAVFGGSAGTVTLGVPISVGGLRFDITSYTLTAGTHGLTFGAANNTIFADASNAATTSIISGTVGGSGNLML